VRGEGDLTVPEQQAVAPPGATDNDLGGVSCVSATFCEAVGTHFDSAGNQVVLAEAWNGQKWTIQSIPALPNPSGSSSITNGLDQVPCVSTQFCEAVGAGSAGAFALMWNGTSWTTQTLAGTVSTSMNAVSCTGMARRGLWSRART
jgi:hypothetical protein